MSEKITIKLCKRCDKKFTNKVTHNGTSFYSNQRLYCLDCSPIQEPKNYPHKYYCPQCKQILTKNDFHWHTKLQDIRHNAECKQCCNENNRQKMLYIKQKWVDYAGGCCSKCGYNKCLAALEFHHVDPNTKDTNFKSLIKTLKDNQIEAELKKCILVCSNCHRELHN